MASKPLSQELEVYEAHRAELLAASPGKFVLIHGDDIVGVFDTKRDAIDDGYRQFGNVAFLVKEISPVDVPVNFVSSGVLGF